MTLPANTPSRPAIRIPRLYLSAAHKSSGKTTITLGLCAALRARGLEVRPFKKGPDYIDPIWLGMAAGHDCYNLDFHTMDRAEIRRMFTRQSAGGDVALIEGNKGLYDGVDPEGGNSNAALAQWLDTPVVLVVDTRGMTRGIAPLLRGYLGFEPKVTIAGVLLNQVGGARHEGKLRAAVERYTDLPVLGAIGHDSALLLPERHLGLIPGNEFGDASGFIARAARAMEEYVDLDRLLAVAASAPPLPAGEEPGEEQSAGDLSPACPPARGKVTIAIARDAAFGFYYPDDLAALGRAGAELVFFNALSDTALPEADALFIGGGFPEVHMRALEANQKLRRAIRAAIEGGIPAYAECGGLMYLTRGITWQGERREMAGVLPAESIMHDRPQGKGYVRLQETGKIPWGIVSSGEPAGDGIIEAHEFHHASVSLLGEGEGIDYAYRVLRGHGLDGQHDGIVYRNLLAGFSHLRDVEKNHWAARFVAYVRKMRQTR
uniref:Cobyrinate a,c-diamide synthase n=1 Tax=Candidatus Kentrum sp. DK TaxID=2126562 RepID=A0A450S3Z0_9GAMM|nr:MAG: cobyrinic acid a,c-diamide synthase [Candidatus Kentron sp. DK]